MPEDVNLIDGLRDEIKRNRELIEAYESLGQAGLFGLHMITQDVEAAENALATQDVVGMIESLKTLRGNE